MPRLAVLYRFTERVRERIKRPRFLVAPVALLVVAVVATASVVLVPRPSHAVFDQSIIGEVMTSYDGDPNVQFVEIEMEEFRQNQVANTVLAAFDATGAYVDDVLVVPSDVAESADGLSWLMATAQFEVVSGLAPDFVMPAGLLTGGGMVCWGAPLVFPPADPSSWDHTDPTNYIDCVAYGTYSGPSNTHVGSPTPLDGDGHSLQRVGDTNNNAADFACGDPADPTTNAPLAASLPATSPCLTPPIPTPTTTIMAAPSLTPTATATTMLGAATPTSTTMPGAATPTTPAGCVDDSFEDDDTPNTATPVTLPFMADLRICPLDDSDWFAFPLSAGDEVQIEALFSHAEGDIEIQFWSVPGPVLVTETTSATDNEKVTYTATTTGPYGARVLLVADAGTVPGNSYTLQISVSPATVPTSTPTVTPIRFGDVNCDGAVNSIDAALVLQFGAGLVTSLACQIGADVNGDGTINSIDAALILQFGAGLLGSLPV